MIIDKDNIKLILIILVVSLGIGYAYINKRYLEPVVETISMREMVNLDMNMLAL